MHLETKATAIPAKVKEAVHRRDKGRCVLCGVPGDPVAHVIRRSHGGMGSERNIVTLCPDCHRAYDEGTGLDRFGRGTTRESIGDYLTAYLKRFYPNWTPESVTYKKWRD